MKLVKGLLAIAIVLLLIGLAGWQFWGKDQLVYVQIATAYTAKQVCSCRFVAKRELDHCKVDFTDDVSALKITQSGQQIISTAPLGMARARAQFKSGLGCSLIG